MLRAEVRSGGRERSTRPTAADFVRERYLTLDARSLGLFRVLLGLLLSAELVWRWLSVRAFYTNDGVLPNHFALFRPLGPRPLSVYYAFSSFAEVNWAFALTLVVFVLFTLGYRTKLFHVLALLCVTGLDTRNLFLEDTGEVALHVLALWTVFLPLGERFSVDALLRSLSEHAEGTSSELDARSRSDAAAVTGPSLAVLALRLQWSVIYVCDIVRSLRAGNIRPTVGGELLIEMLLVALLLLPLRASSWAKYALGLALLLHGATLLQARLGLLPWVMILGFVPYFAREDWTKLIEWRKARGRGRTIIYDSDCGMCLFLARVLARLDLFVRLSFVGNHERERIPEALDEATLDRTVVVVGPQGQFLLEQRAVSEVLAALPFGIALGVWLRVPGLSSLAARAYRWVARNRQSISAWFGFGACGLDAPIPATGRVTDEPEHQPRITFRGTLETRLALVREIAVAFLMLAVGAQVAIDNSVKVEWLRQARPEWMASVVEYPRIFQSFVGLRERAPEEAGRLVVDGRTADGRKWDPLTGEEPNFSPRSVAHRRQSGFWLEYGERIRLPENLPYRNHLRDYLSRLHQFSERPQDTLVAFDVWWVHTQKLASVAPEHMAEPPERLASFGIVRDSLAKPWLQRGSASP